jgi:hypothetical protein
LGELKTLLEGDRTSMELIERLAAALGEGGAVLMALGDYCFSTQFS